MSVSCARCGQTWEKNPILEVECPVCQAKPGQKCKRPSEHEAWEPHIPREQLAMDRGFLQKCPGPPGKINQLQLL